MSGKRRQKKKDFEKVLSEMRPINSYFSKKTQNLNEKHKGESNPDEKLTQHFDKSTEDTLLDGQTIPASAGGTKKF